MNHWFSELDEALDHAPAPVSFFFRDDDVGWAEERLFMLLDVFEAHRAPIDLAVIPTALEDDTAERLRQRLAASAGRMRAHQHGFAHLDHQRSGRKSEFGSDRALGEQRADLVLGAELLTRRLAPHVDPIFTPPWNRCRPELGPLLLSAGLRVLSRDRTAAPLRTSGLVELPVTVDWLASMSGGSAGVASLGAGLARSVREDAAVGVMLHHARMDATDRVPLEVLLKLLEEHPRARCVSMRSLARRSRP